MIIILDPLRPEIKKEKYPQTCPIHKTPVVMGF